MAFCTPSMTGYTVNIRNTHETRGVRNTYPPTPTIKVSRDQMHFFAMAPITNGGGMDKCENRSNLMPNVSMATRTFDFVLGDMILVHEFRSILGPQYFGFVMTLSAFPLGDMTISFVLTTNL